MVHNTGPTLNNNNDFCKSNLMLTADNSVERLVMAIPAMMRDSSFNKISVKDEQRMFANDNYTNIESKRSKSTVRRGAGGGMPKPLFQK